MYEYIFGLYQINYDHSKRLLFSVFLIITANVKRVSDTLMTKSVLQVKLTKV